jgi:ion channel
VRLLAGLLGFALLALVLRDAFETIILPRRITREFRLTTLFYRASWRCWRGVSVRVAGRFRENSLAWYGPFSLLMLLAFWALSMVVAFGLLHWAGGSALSTTGHAPGLLDDLYFSGTTFVTLGLGDMAPLSTFGKVLTVTEAGLGFAFLAITIGYLPIIYQAFSRREIAISMLDARAGSPPSAGELLLRHGGDAEHCHLAQLLGEWERWSAEVLESHLSYPVLAYFRSQHWNQSWLAALTMVLDTSAVVMQGCEGRCVQQAHLTFAMARHAVVDLAQVFSARQPMNLEERLPEADFARLVEQIGKAGVSFVHPDARIRLARVRALYEPYVTALSRHLELPLPAWIRRSERPDNWESAPWKLEPAGSETVEHF